SRRQNADGAVLRAVERRGWGADWNFQRRPASGRRNRRDVIVAFATFPNESSARDVGNGNNRWRIGPSGAGFPRGGVSGEFVDVNATVARSVRGMIARVVGDGGVAGNRL